MIDTYERSYFTFGPEQYLPDGSVGTHAFVIVVGPKWLDKRALFMQWLGSNDFSSEYDEQDWDDDIRDSYYRDTEPNTVIRVDELN